MRPYVRMNWGFKPTHDRSSPRVMSSEYEAPHTSSCTTPKTLSIPPHWPPSNSSSRPPQASNTKKPTLPLVQNKRKSAPKSRTGCLTCKYVPFPSTTWYIYRTDILARKRHVKCDEGKPSCQWCTTLGVGCDGYPGKHTALKQALILPKQTGEHRILIPQRPQAKAIATERRPSPLRVMQSGAGFDSEADSLAFRVYLEDTAKQMPGYFAISIWDLLIP